MMNSTVVLVDGLNLAFRTYHAMRNLQTSDGTSTAVLYGFLNHVQTLYSQFGACDMLFFWEGKIAGLADTYVPPWRRTVLSEKYKSNREINEHTLSVHAQVDKLVPVLRTLGYAQYQVPSIEADDLIGIAATALSREDSIHKVVVYSSDKDMYQLIDDKVVVAVKRTGKYTEITERTVRKSFGVDPYIWSQYRALVGDKSDAYAGLKGCGPKTAPEYLQQGLDPKVPEFSDLPKSVRSSFSNLKKDWPEIHRCYLLSYIPRTYKYKLLPSEARPAIKQIVASLHAGRHRRMTRAQYKQALHSFTAFCADHQLHTFLADRRRFLNTVEII